MSQNTALLQMKDLVVGYHKQGLLPPCSLSLCAGDMWAVLGPNGAGKTTMIKTLLGLLPAVAGSMHWSQHAQVGYVPQRTQIDLRVPGRVKDIVAGGVEQNWSFLNPVWRRQRKAAITRAMKDTQVAALAYQQFITLSEGQKQRVLMARALASEPSVLILDEPTSAMDLSAEHTVLSLLNTLRTTRQLAVLIVSHHLHVIGTFATHALLVDKDHQALISGTLDQVAEHQACVSLYGSVLRDAAAHNHNCCDHDHALPEPH